MYIRCVCVCACAFVFVCIISLQAHAIGELRLNHIINNYTLHFFDVLLTVHLSIILAINQLNAQNLVLL